MAKATTVDAAQKADKPVKTSKPGKPVKAAKPNVFARFAGYIRDVRSEMKRVVWPSRNEVVNSSVVVVTTLVFFIAFIALTDFIVIRVVDFIQKIGG
jgi:preprotein translocase subunit SecE